MNAEALPKQPSEGESDDIKPIHPAQPPSEEDGQNPQTQNKDNQLIDVSALVVNQTYSEGVIGGHKIFKIKERKPTKHEWFRVNPEPDYKQMLSGFVYECGGEKVTYLANSEVAQYLESHGAECRPLNTRICCSKTLVPFLWIIAGPTGSMAGRETPWLNNQLEAARRAEKTWVRLQWNAPEMQHDIYENPQIVVEPKFPEKAFQEIITEVFREKHLASIDHPVVKDITSQ